MIRKPFEQDLHDKYDESGKRVVIKFLRDRYGFDAIPNTDKYGVDLLVFKDYEFIGNAEVEVRQWNIPFDTIHVPSRKEKFFDKETVFFAVTQDMKHVYWIKTEQIKNYQLKEVKNVKVKEGELFYDVPTDQFNCASI